MPLLCCPHCGQSYNPAYIRYCARCGEPVADARGRLPKAGPMDGMGSRGGAMRRKAVAAARPPAEKAPATAPPPQEWRPPQSVTDLVQEYRSRLNTTPEDHSTRYALGLAYLLARQWQQAEAELRAVTEAVPDYAEAFCRLAICRWRLGDPQGALQAAERAEGLSPGRAEYAALSERLRRSCELPP